MYPTMYVLVALNYYFFKVKFGKWTVVIVRTLKKNYTCLWKKKVSS